MKCMNCEKPLTGRRTKYCSRECGSVVRDAERYKPGTEANRKNREYMRKYMRKYLKNPENKEKHAESVRKYAATEKGQNARRKYQSSAKGKAAQKRYNENRRGKNGEE